MPLAYTVPKSFDSLLQEEYARIAEHYERVHPNVIVGHPSLWDQERFAEGFSSQDAFHAYLDEKVGLLFSLQKEIRSRWLFKGGLSREFMRFLDEIKKCTSISQHILAEAQESREYDFRDKDIKTGAGYEIITDTIYLDPYFLSVFLLTGAALREGLPTGMKIPIHLQHELVHFDLGGCKMFVDLRALSHKVDDPLNEFFELAKVIQEGSYGDVQRWQAEKPEREAFIEKVSVLQSQGDVLDALMQESEESRMQCGGLSALRSLLHLDIGEEALAYAYTNERKGFDLFLRIRKNLSSVEYSRSFALYDILKDKLIEHEGRLCTLQKMKQAHNQAYTEKKDIFDIFL